LFIAILLVSGRDHPLTHGGRSDMKSRSVPLMDRVMQVTM
jgi:hypothetical protein